jgi:signal transduction histidine kinase
MTFPKASVKFEKPPFLRGLRWKIMVGFLVLAFGLLFVLGSIGGVIEYAALREDFAQSAGSESESFLYWTGLQADNVFSIDQNNLKKDSAEMIPWLSSNPQNTVAIRLWLTLYIEKLKLLRKEHFQTAYTLNNPSPQSPITNESDKTAEKRLFHFVVFDSNMSVTSATDTVTESEARKFVEEFLKEGLTEKKEFTKDSGAKVKFAFLLFDEQNNRKGVLYFREDLPIDWSQAYLLAIPAIFDQLIPNLIFFAIIGFIFGSPLAWYISKRLKNIAFTAQSWRTGDFSAKTNDKSSDEIGILSRRLNEMADDLRENFALRQTIATAEERNRIARDLHDSVKQQVFGLAMQISTASALVEKDNEAAKSYLVESENLIKEIQAELVDMIHEFSLPVNESQTFKVKIENFVSDWSRQNVMKTEINVDEKLRIPTEIAQTFYRITQESLSNIARHSEATEVKISLKNSNKKLNMSFIDNGCGFDTAKIKKGFGLQSIRERAESLPNGWLKIDSKINSGTTIEVGCEAKESI